MIQDSSEYESWSCYSSHRKLNSLWTQAMFLVVYSKRNVIFFHTSQHAKSDIIIILTNENKLKDLKKSIKTSQFQDPCFFTTFDYNLQLIASTMIKKVIISCNKTISKRPPPAASRWENVWPIKKSCLQFLCLNPFFLI